MSDEPVFLHGILPRSGTNYLWDLLLLHPDCARGREPVNEDLFLDHADPLVDFVKTVREAWDPIWGDYPAGISDDLCAALGRGLLSFLRVDDGRRLIAKSPSVRHIDWFFRFFPQAKLLLLVRDGRSVAQSAMATFGWDLDRAGRAWAEAAREILTFQRAESTRADSWLVIRYEDLVDDPEETLRSIFEFLGLDPNRYDFDAARDLPVRGSSAFGRREGQVHWESVPRDAQFDPRARWQTWTPAQRNRFEWLAGQELHALGYGPAPVPTSLGATVQQSGRDLIWNTSRLVRLMTYRLRVKLAIRTRIAGLLKASPRA